jgi:hypothetical protein
MIQVYSGSGSSAFFPCFFFPFFFPFFGGCKLEFASSTVPLCRLAGRGFGSGSSTSRFCFSAGLLSRDLRRLSNLASFSSRSTTTCASLLATSSALTGSLDESTTILLVSRRMGLNLCVARLSLNFLSNGQPLAVWSLTFGVGVPCQQKEHRSL